MRERWMIVVRRGLQGVLLPAVLLPSLTGCFSLIPHTRKLQVLKSPPTIMNADAAQLVSRVNAKYDSVQSLNFTVDFQPTIGGERKGKVTDYTSFLGHILLRKPNMLRVIGLLPVLHSRAFDLASNGTTFKLLIPHDNKVIEGSSTMTRKSAKAIENLRPGVFVDSMLIRSIGPDDLVFLTTSQRTRPDGKSKQLLEEPDYDLSVVRRKEGGNELVPVRSIHFSRIDLTPFEQDLYDKDGNIETQTLYGPPQTFGDTQYPGTVTIRRPLEEYQITITVEKVTLNQTPPLTDDQFDFKVPDGVTVQKLD